MKWMVRSTKIQKYFAYFADMYLGFHFIRCMGCSIPWGFNQGGVMIRKKERKKEKKKERKKEGKQEGKKKTEQKGKKTCKIPIYIIYCKHIFKKNASTASHSHATHCGELRWMLAKCPQQAWRSGTMAGTAHSASCTGSLQQAAWLKRLASLGPVSPVETRFPIGFFPSRPPWGGFLIATFDCHVW